MKPHDQTYPQVFPEIEDWPIYKLHDDRRNFVDEIDAFTFERLHEEHDDIGKLVAKVLYLERIRMKEEPWKVDPPKDPQFWKRISKKLIKKSLDRSPEEAKGVNDELLKQVIRRYSEEIVGTFKKRTFLFTRRFLTAFFGRLLNTAAHRNLFRTRSRLYDHLQAHGHVEQVRELMKRGTVVVVPTHFSNIDSVLVGYALDGIVGLPSFSYGAGLNLYNSGPAAYFMNRLGAYRLDRRKKNPIYLNTLKAMSNISIQRGTNTIFFPGGTRMRSGAMEKRLKRGLLGTAVEAQRALYEKGEDKKIFIVPVILGYHFVLEAKYLIEEHLRRAGKEEYLRTKDKSNSIRQFLRFAWTLFSTSNDIIVSIGKPMDVLGNYVDEQGNSYGKNNEVVQLRDYFTSFGELTADRQRESVYTDVLAKRIVERYFKDNIVLTSQLVAFAAFNLLRYENNDTDLYGLLRLPPEEYEFSKRKFMAIVAQLQAHLFKMEAAEEIKLSPLIKENTAVLVRDGIRRIGSYHESNPLFFNKEKQLVSKSFPLLFYYHNRLEHYGLEQAINWEEVMKSSG